ncbi:hypothetical protein AGMMS50284_6890 [Clostridia bacterium]|nr:hypothetical protein AGMMS50284_6890 [Clostridia bacterium]
MSKKYKNHVALNIIITAFLLFIVTPVIPISFLLLFAMYLFEIKGKYAVLIGILGLAILCLCFRNIMIHFLQDFGSVLNAGLSGFGTENIFSGLLLYSISSYLVILFGSLLLAGWYLSQMEKQEKYHKAGIKTLHAEVNKISEQNISSNQSDQKTSMFEDIKNDEKTYLGVNTSNKKVFCEDNAKHIFVSGTTGSGKTVLLSNFIQSACSKNYGLLLIDGKGDTGKGSMLAVTKHFCELYKRKLYVVDMNHPDSSNKYNPFSGASETVCKDMLINMSEWSEEHYKINTERYLQRLIKLLNLNGEKLSFESILENMTGEKLKELSMQLEDKGLITKQEHMTNLDMIKQSAKIVASANARFATIAESEIGKIFDQDGIDIVTAMKEKSVIIFVLNPLLFHETSSAFGRLILIDSKKAVSHLFGDEARKFFLFDEINVYASSVLVDLINKSRSAGVTCISATQSLADLETVTGDKLKDQIIENCNNYIILRQNSFSSAEQWAKTLGTKETMKMTYQILDDIDNMDNKGSARLVREFIIHPDQIKAQKTGEAVYLSKDSGAFERIKVNKPF